MADTQNRCIILLIPWEHILAFSDLPVSALVLLLGPLSLVGAYITAANTIVCITVDARKVLEVSRLFGLCRARVELAYIGGVELRLVANSEVESRQIVESNSFTRGMGIGIRCVRWTMRHSWANGYWATHNSTTDFVCLSVVLKNDQGENRKNIPPIYIPFDQHRLSKLLIYLRAEGLEITGSLGQSLVDRHHL